MSSNQNKQKSANNSKEDKPAPKQNIFGGPSNVDSINMLTSKNQNSGGMGIFNKNIQSKAGLFNNKQKNKKPQSKGNQPVLGLLKSQTQNQKKEPKPKSQNQQKIIGKQQVKQQEKVNKNQSDQKIQDNNVKKENNQSINLLLDKNKNKLFENPNNQLFKTNSNSIFGVKKQNEPNFGSSVINSNKETINPNSKKNDSQQSEGLFGSSSSNSNENIFGISSKTTGGIGNIFGNQPNNTQKKGGLFDNIAPKAMNTFNTNSGTPSMFQPKQSAQNKQKDQQKGFSLKNPVPTQKSSTNDLFKPNTSLFEPSKTSNFFGSNQQNIDKKQGTLQTRASQETNNLRSVEDNSRQKSKQKSIQKRQQQKIVLQPTTLKQKQKKLELKKQQLINRLAQLKKSNKQVNLQAIRQKGYQQKQEQLKAKVNAMKQEIQNNRAKKQSYQRQIQQFTAKSKQLKERVDPKSQPFLLKELFKLQKQKQNRPIYPQKKQIVNEIKTLGKTIKQFYQNNQFLQQKKPNQIQLSPQQQLKSLWHKCQNSLQEIQKLKKQEKQQISKNQALLRNIYSLQQQKMKKIDAKQEEDHIEFNQKQNQFKKYKQEGLKHFIEQNQKLQQQYNKLVQELNKINQSQMNPIKNSARSSILMRSVIRDFQMV